MGLLGAEPRDDADDDVVIGEPSPARTTSALRRTRGRRRSRSLRDGHLADGLANESSSTPSSAAGTPPAGGQQHEGIRDGKRSRTVERGSAPAPDRGEVHVVGRDEGHRHAGDPAAARPSARGRGGGGRPAPTSAPSAGGWPPGGAGCGGRTGPPCRAPRPGTRRHGTRRPAAPPRAGTPPGGGPQPGPCPERSNSTVSAPPTKVRSRTTVSRIGGSWSPFCPVVGPAGPSVDRGERPTGSLHARVEAETPSSTRVRAAAPIVRRQAGGRAAPRPTGVGQGRRVMRRHG